MKWVALLSTQQTFQPLHRHRSTVDSRAYGLSKCIFYTYVCCVITLYAFLAFFHVVITGYIIVVLCNCGSAFEYKWVRIDTSVNQCTAHTIVTHTRTWTCSRFIVCNCSNLATYMANTWHIQWMTFNTYKLKKQLITSASTTSHVPALQLERQHNYWLKKHSFKAYLSQLNPSIQRDC